MEMEPIVRKNRMGNTYTLRQEVGLDGKPTGNTLIQLAMKQITVHHTIDKINDGWYKWTIQGKLIQDAFPFFTPDEREFLITGMTTEDWAKLFGKEDE